MRLDPDHIILRSEYHPHTPLQVLAFLKKDLKLGKRYVVLAMGKGVEHLSKLLVKHIHLLCVIDSTPSYKAFIENYLGSQKNLLCLEASAQASSLDADSIDHVIVLGNMLQQWGDLMEEVRKELSRVLRLNSYVVLVKHELLMEEMTFSWAYHQFHRQYANGKDFEYSNPPKEENLNAFFEDGFEHKLFANQLRLNWEGLQGFYQASESALNPDEPHFRFAIKALRILFEQYQIDGVVTLDFKAHVYYGLFNKNVPAISLRKNLFFTLLRPFAFGFYVMVKLNIYFWESLYRLKEKLFNKKKKDEKNR